MDSQNSSPRIPLGPAFFLCLGGLFNLFCAGAFILPSPGSTCTSAFWVGVGLVGFSALVTLRLPRISLIMVLLALAALLVGFFLGYIEADKNYDLAMRWMQEGKYEKAQNLFDNMEYFRDSLEKADDCGNYILYTDAVEDLDSSPESAYRALRKLEGFAPADEMLASPVMQAARESSLAVGKWVDFGRYYDSLSFSDDVSWRIIARDGDRALLLSYYIMEERPFHDTEQPVTWADCSLRQWMNGEFLNTLFTAEEQAVIEPTRITIGDGSVSTTQDRLFLLSYSEVYKYFPDASDRKIHVTDYVKYKYDTPSYDDWLVRPVGEAGTTAPRIDYKGVLRQEDAVSTPSGIRPAMWVVLDPEFF